VVKASKGIMEGTRQKFRRRARDRGLSPITRSFVEYEVGQKVVIVIEKLNELDTTAVEAMAQVLYEAPETLTLRDDSDRPGLPQEKSLGNAPESGAGQFKVAKVIER